MRLHPTERLMRNGLSYHQAVTNCNRISSREYDLAIERGETIEAAQKAAKTAFEKEMSWYLS